MTSNAEPGGLRVQVYRRVHPGLALDVAFELGREIGVLFGASGAGKSTLLRLIAGLTIPDDGLIRLDQEIIFDSSKRVDVSLRDRSIGMIFQHDLLFPHLRVDRNIGFGLKNWPRARASERIQEVASLCGVGQLLDRRPETLSGGERQRVGLARSLAPRPGLLLCDEPVSALDLAGRHALIDRLKIVQRAEDIPILYVTHSSAEAIALGDTMFLMDRGKIVERGHPLDVLGRHRQAEKGSWGGIRNIFSALVDGARAASDSSTLQLLNGPTLRVPALELEHGTVVSVAIHAADIILANGPVTGLSAQNVLPGVVERVVPHGDEAEVIVRTVGVNWTASLVVSTIAQLELAPGSQVHLIVKARSCLVTARS